MTLLAIVVEWAGRALVLGVVAGIGLAVLRVRRAAVRHAVWTTVLVAGLVIPILALALPPLEWPLPIALPASWSTTTIAANTAEPPSSASASVSSVAPSASSAPTPPPITHSAQPSPSRAAFSWPLVALAVYIFGVLFMLSRVALGWWLAHRLLRSAPLIEDDAPRARLRRAALAAGLKRVPAIAETHLTVVPMTMAAMRPVIVLPVDWSTWSPATLDAVLVHELAHIARRDAFTQQLSLLYRAVFWFSPLAWWLRRRLTVLAEDACDEAVLDTGVDRASYAEIVLGFFAALRTRPRRANWPAIAMAAGSGGSKRVERILSWAAARRRALPTWSIVAIAIVTVGLVTALAVIQPIVASSGSIPTLESRELFAPIAAPSPVAPTIPKSARTQTPSVVTPPDTPSPRIDPVATDVIVRDAQGQTVGDLTAKDFRIFEDGVEQTIDVFRAPIVWDGTLLRFRPLPAASSDQAADGLFVVFIDDANVERADFPRLVRILEQIRDRLRDNDLVAIFSTGYSSIEVDATYDRGHARFNQAIAKIASVDPTSASPLVAGRDPHVVHTALRTARDVVERASQIGNRKKTVIYVSGGYDINVFSKAAEADLVADMAELIRSAVRANMKFYMLSPRTPSAGPDAMVNSLRALATNTGGFLIGDSDMAAEFGSVGLNPVAAAWYYYVIGYTSSNKDLSKLRRRVEIRVDRPGLRADYRNEYTIKK